MLVLSGCTACTEQPLPPPPPTPADTSIAYQSATQVPIPGNQWVIEYGTPTRGGNVWTFPRSGTHVISYGLMLPPGVAITSILWSFDRNSTTGSGSLTMAMSRRSFGDGGADTAAITQGTVSSGTGFATHDSSADGGLPHTVLGNFLYQLEFQSSPSPTGTPFFDGAIVTVDRP
jgi:hypothetical protein